MNIGIVTVWFPSGAGYVSRAYSETLRQEHQVFIYARGGQAMHGDAVWDDASVTWAPYHPYPTGIFNGHLSKWVKRHQIDALLFNEQRQYSALVLAKTLGVLSGAYVDYYTQETVDFFELYDFIVCNTARHYSVFRHHEQCLYIPWGTNTERFKPGESRPERPLTFLLSAGWDGSYAKWRPWMDRRGAGLLMRAFRRVRGDVRLLVYSQVPIERCPEGWRESLEEDSRITFKFGTFDPFPFHEGDVYVYPSRLDGIGLSLYEALSCGLPAITTDSGPMNEVVRDAENGFLVPVVEYRGRPDGYYWAESLCGEDALVSAISRYVQEPGMVSKHGSNARRMAQVHLSWSDNARNLCGYISACRRRPENLHRAMVGERALRFDRFYSPTLMQRGSMLLRLACGYYTGRIDRLIRTNFRRKAEGKC